MLCNFLLGLCSVLMKIGTYVSSCRDHKKCKDGLEIHCSKGAVYTFDAIEADGAIT